MKHLNSLSVVIFICAISLSISVSAEGINCDKLPALSTTAPAVNLHHIFCGEINKKGNAVGFHSRPGGENPTTYIRSTPLGTPNAAGVYRLQNIKLSINGIIVVKPMSSMFPDHCSQSQVINSIVYAADNSTASCSNPSWARCGPGSPEKDNEEYCVGSDGSILTIGTAQLNANIINTGFPIY